MNWSKSVAARILDTYSEVADLALGHTVFLSIHHFLSTKTNVLLPQMQAVETPLGTTSTSGQESSLSTNQSLSKVSV